MFENAKEKIRKMNKLTSLKISLMGNNLTCDAFKNIGDIFEELRNLHTLELQLG